MEEVQRHRIPLPIIVPFTCHGGTRNDREIFPSLRPRGLHRDVVPKAIDFTMMASVLWWKRRQMQELDKAKNITTVRQGTQHDKTHCDGQRGAVKDGLKSISSGVPKVIFERGLTYLQDFRACSKN
ncbi:hypothetical protein HAX54_005747 [Datura stramonium]|uniref:Uncharacterized protein n=1 Tax=Datura stramonium TaxID=4076 RepID=A0ABS8WTK8_DATST|nr:hypothetical protein [Datura stramonium]